jgi:5-methylcytosine-specific restriction endonuclease McrA
MKYTDSMSTWKERFIAEHGQEAYDLRKRQIADANRRRYHGDAAYREKVLADSKVSHAKTPREILAARVLASRNKKLEYYKEHSRNHENAKRAAMSPEERKAHDRKSWASKREAIAVMTATELASYRANKRAKHLAWREANREHVNAKARETSARNPERRSAIRSANHHKRRAAGPVDWKYLKFLKEQPCYDCGSTEKIELGHLIPIKNGGTNNNQNFIPQCRSCNRKLHSRVHAKATICYPGYSVYLKAA